MRRFIRNNSLSLVTFGLFLVFWVAQSLTGWVDANHDHQDHQRPTESYARYLRSGHFVEATFENWASEFLQMGFYVLLTVYLRQKGSPESKPLQGKEKVDADPRQEPDRRHAPWPVRRGGLALAIYERSLTLALLTLFLLSFVLHAAGGTADYNAEQREHGQPAVSVASYVTTSHFWFQSFQNWQSEFMAVGSLVLLGVFLRQRGSPESKPVAASHAATGSE
jgi:hypothetical protein